MLAGMDASRLASWRPHPFLVALVAGAGVWDLAARRRATRDGRRRQLEAWRGWAFGAGLAVLAAAWLSPLSGLDRHLLSAAFGSMFLVSTLAPALVLLGQRARRSPLPSSRACGRGGSGFAVSRGVSPCAW